MERTAVVTGATGFIGSHLTKALKADGWRVIEAPRSLPFRVRCARVYHLACPSTTEYINEHPQEIINTIVDGTRRAMQICPSAMFVNASSMGATHVSEVDNYPQVAYNAAKRVMELYIEHSNSPHINYRLPSIYGDGMHDDNFIKRCVDGRAYCPPDPDRVYHIAHIDDAIDAMVGLKCVPIEETTLGEIYEAFSTGRRGLHRPAPDTYSTKNNCAQCRSN